MRPSRPAVFLKLSSASRYKPKLHNAWNVIRYSSNSKNVQNASDKLFADAAREESEQKNTKSSRLTVLEQEDENWTGDELIRDTVLRMLMDKHKPLRGGTIQSAEQKLRQAPPTVAFPTGPIPSQPSAPSTPDFNTWADQPLLPSNEEHRPWHTQFKAPSHAVSSVKLGRLPPSPVRRPSAPMDERAKRKEREAKKREMHAGRLTQAKESTLDYRLGLRGSRGNVGMRPNPMSMKGWTSLIEDKIEKARLAGLFNVVKGRGKPLARTTEEHNPFIDREEFLMNRIVQRNGAAPPWVEVQGELDTAVTAFRAILRQSWTRRALRILTTSTPPELLHTIKLSNVKVLRDPEWVQREIGYHDTAVGELNALVRKYNGLAPYAVRRPYYVRSVEVESLYDACAEDIMEGLKERIVDRNVRLGTGALAGGDGDRMVGGRGGGGVEDGVVRSGGAALWDMFNLMKRWIDKIASRLWGRNL